MKQNYVVIMAGGIGSRFWPMSSEAKPKQFLDILGTGRTLLQMTFDRFAPLCPAENTLVVTSESYAALVREQLPELPEANILTEPVRRNTAPCIAYASWKIKSRDPQANIVVTPSDHFIEDVEGFQKCISSCLSFTAETDAIVTIGIKPTHPETGYGYIKADLGYASPTNSSIYRVDSFKEKPDIDMARKYVSQPDYLWNAGIFVWNVRTIVNTFRVCQPDMARIFEGLLGTFDTPAEAAQIKELFPKCENISVDYAIMEHSDDIYVHPADFGWSDLGSWSSLRSHLPKDIYGNACIGDDISMYDSQNCIVHTSGERKVVVQGLDGYIVVEKDGTLLICKLSEEQRIKLFH